MSGSVDFADPILAVKPNGVPRIGRNAAGIAYGTDGRVNADFPRLRPTPQVNAAKKQVDVAAGISS
jgi:hypothetical protein